MRTTPKPPSNPTVSAAKDSVTISWSAVSGATSYDLMFDGKNYRVNGTSKTITGLTPGTSYTYSVCANNTDGSSSYTTVNTVTTIASPPGIPKNVRVNVTAESATISWDPVSGATSYDVKFHGDTYNVTETSKTITGLSPNVSYEYSVRAKNASGSSSYTVLETVLTPVKPPAAPTGVTASTSTTLVTLSWKAVIGATNYDVLFDGKVYNVEGTSKTITGLIPGATYTYAVRANNAGGSGTYSELKTVTTIPNPPAIPINISASATANSVTISWSAVNGADSYDIWFDNTVFNVTDTSKTISGLRPGTRHEYSVCAKNRGGAGFYSDTKSVQTLPAPLAPPNTPTGISYSCSSDYVKIRWNAVNNAASYDVSFNGKLYNVTNTTMMFSGLTSNTSYSFQIRARNAAGVSAYSDVWMVCTLPPLPSTPSNVRAVATINSATVSWNAVSGAVSYDVLFNGTTYNVTGTSKTITGLVSGTNYTYAVRARSGGGSSAYSAAQIIKTLSAPPDVPVNVDAIATVNSATVRWGAVREATGYDIFFNGKTYEETDPFITFAGLSANTDYTYQVRAKNAVGISEYSTAQTVRTRLNTPDNIRAVADIKTVIISWNQVNGATSYDIAFNGKVYNSADTFIEFTGLVPETGYAYAVCAKNEVVSSEYSQTYIVNTLMDVPAVPENVNAVSTMNRVIVSWNQVKGADSYDVDFDGMIYGVTSGTTRTFSASRSRKSSTIRVFKVFAGLKPNTEHSYCVRAKSERGSSAYSQKKTILTKISKKSGLPNAKSNRTYPDGKVPYMGLDPVNALTGAFLWSYTWMEDYGKDGLHFTAMYDSERDEYPKVLGNKWTYSLNYLLYMDSKYAYFSTPYDEVIPFSMDVENGSYQPAEEIGAGYTMERKGGFYCIRGLDGTEYIFDNNLHLSKIVEGGLEIYQFGVDKEGHITNIEGRHGAILTLAYANGHIARVADAMGNAAAFTYEGEQLIAVANSAGKGLSFSYDNSGNLVEIKDFAGKIYLTNQYDIKNRVVMQNTIGRGDSFASYDEENRVTTFTDELGNITKYFYDEIQQVTSVELGGTGVQSKYNSKGQLTEQTDALGNTTQMAYDECGRMNQMTYPDGAKEQIFYNDRNYPVRIINRDGTESLYKYDEHNNLVWMQDERGNIASYTYDSKDNLISHTDKNGNLWTYTYDSNNHLEKVSDPEGNVNKYSHDAIGRLISETSPAGKKTAYHYSGAGDLIRIEDEDGNIIFEYNENGNQTGVTDRRGNKQRLEYNEMGQLSRATDFMGNEYQFFYDKKGNLIREKDPLGYSRDHAYDSMGNQTAETDKNGGETNYSFNAASQLTEVRDGLGNLIKYAYDTSGQIRTVVDKMNYQTDYSYDAMGRIIKITNALGYSISYTYDQAGNLCTKTDENGAVTAYTYDKENRMASIQSDAGTVCFTYDKLGRVLAVQDTDSYFETAQYDGEGNLTEFLDKESNKTTYIYDHSGRLLEETNPKGNKTSYVYDANGNCIKITDAEGNQYLYEYDADNRMTKETNPLKHKTSYEYDARGNLKSVTNGNGGKTAFEYDGNGNILKEVNPLGGVRSYSYDILNRLTETVDEEGNKQSFLYDANGNKTSYTDANSNQWTYEYDKLNRLTGVQSQDTGRLELAYTKTGKIEKVTDQEGAETKYSYDSMDRLIEMSDALENSLRFTYDSQGRILTQTDTAGNKTEYQYSPSGNLISIKTPEGSSTAYTYNALGQILTEKDALGNVTSYEYDSLGQVTSITDPMGDKTSFAYTGNGEIAAVTDANGSITQYRYDGCGNLIQTIDPMGNTVAYEYDPMNNQIKECLDTPNGQMCTTIYRYDKSSRMVKEINPMLEEKEYTYDGNGNIVTILDEEKQETRVKYDLNNKPVNMCYSDGKEAAFRYNKRGELVELKDWNGTASMEYGKTGKLQKVTDHMGRMTGYHYDGNGNTTGITYPDGSTVSYAYDKNNRITKVTDGEGQITQYEYNLTGNIKSICQPGSTAAYTYNGKGMPAAVKYQMHDGTTMEHSYSYDALGNITGLERKGNTPELTGKAEYSYDALGQLLSSKEGTVTESYGYDTFGNRIYKKVNGIENTSYQYNGLNQLISRTENAIAYHYGYDRRGNLTEERKGENPVKRYIYDATNHMVQGANLETGEKTEYGYNGLYMRVKNKQTLTNSRSGYRSYKEKTEGVSIPELFLTKETSYVTDYLSEANKELMCYEEGYGTIKATYGAGSQRLSQKVTLNPKHPVTAKGVIASEKIGKSYFQSDLLGSVLLASNERGEVLRYGERSPWGELKIPVQEDFNSAGVENSLKYTNYCYDPVIDKDFAQARFYDAKQGRMLAKDPVKRGLNPYPYCKNNPINYVDPTGEVANILAGTVIGGVTGGIFGFAGNALSQVRRGEKFDVRKAIGSGANGMIVGAARGAILSSGVGLAASFLGDFAAGAIGNGLEQQIGRGSIDVGESITSGLTNAISGAIYGNAPLKSAKNALRRGAMSGAATAAINSLSQAWDTGNGSWEGNPGAGRSQGRSRITAIPYGRSRDPRAACGISSPLKNQIGYRSAYGYQYQESYRYQQEGSSHSRTGEGFSLAEFGKDVLLGAVMGGLSSVVFYKGSQAVDALRGSVRGARRNEGGSSPQNYFPKDADGNPIPLAKQRVNGQDIPLPDPKAQGPHTVIGGKISSETGLPYRQSATFPEGTWPTANGKNVPWSEVHWGNHGDPLHHTNPHQHIYKYDFVQKFWESQEPTKFY